MFSVTITQDGDTIMEMTETASEAWVMFGTMVQELGSEMMETEKDFAWPVTYVRMVYALGVEGVELEYAKVTIA